MSVDAPERELSVETPGPGVYPGTPMDVYHEWAAMSNSRLSRFARSPAHYVAYIEEPPKETPALKLGRAIHTAVLEPDRWDDLYTTAQGCDAIKGDGDRCTNSGVWQTADKGWVCGIHVKQVEEDQIDRSRAVLSLDDYRTCVGVRDSIQRHSKARGMIEALGDVELSMLWTDADTDVLCKARWDGYAPELPGGAIVDVKSTRDASPRSFEKAIFDFGYHRQGALYLEGARARKLPAKHFVLIAVEKKPPYAVGVYRLTEGALQAGMDHIRPLLRLYKDCVERDEWPAYPDEIRDISIPSWAWSKVDEDIEEIAA